MIRILACTFLASLCLTTVDASASSYKGTGPLRSRRKLQMSGKNDRSSADEDERRPPPPPPMAAALSEPTPGPTLAPTTSAPIEIPVAIPVETPVAAPVAAPVQAPVAPGAGPVAAPVAAPVQAPVVVATPTAEVLNEIERDVEDPVCDESFLPMQVTSKSLIINYLYEIVTDKEELTDVTDAVDKSVEGALIDSLMTASCDGTRRRHLGIDGVTGVFAGDQIPVEEACVNYSPSDVFGLTCYRVQGSAIVYMDEDVAIDEAQVEAATVAAVEEALSAELNADNIRDGILGRTHVSSNTELIFSNGDDDGDSDRGGEGPAQAEAEVNKDKSRSGVRKFFFTVGLLSLCATIVYCVVMRYWDRIVEREIFGPHKLPDDDETLKEEPAAVIADDTMESHSLAEEMGTEAVLNANAKPRESESPTGVHEDLAPTPYATERAMYDRAMYGGMSRTRTPVARTTDILEDLHVSEPVEDAYLMTASEEQVGYDVHLHIERICTNYSSSPREYSSGDTVDL